ncbi:MAG: protein-export chaperone SecB [Marinicaulis sp.]|nr:protein-export chaperone SecB [Marinicaulis sp.]
MTQTPENNGAAAGAIDPANPPTFVVMAQYLKDLSFESPHAPNSFQSTTAPKIDVNVDVQGRTLGRDQYEVELSVQAKAARDAEAVFIVETSYAGVFEIKNLPRDQLEVAMLVECPRLLFPFMRQIVSDATRNGNFPPLMLEPIDFMGIYLRNREQGQASEGGAA